MARGGPACLAALGLGVGGQPGRGLSGSGSSAWRPERLPHPTQAHSLCRVVPSTLVAKEPGACRWALLGQGPPAAHARPLPLHCLQIGEGEGVEAAGLSRSWGWGGGARLGHLAQHCVCAALSQSQRLSLELQGDPEPRQQEGWVERRGCGQRDRRPGVP